MRACPLCGSLYEDDFLDQCPSDNTRLEFVDEKEIFGLDEGESSATSHMSMLSDNYEAQSDRVTDSSGSDVVKRTTVGCILNLLFYSVLIAIISWVASFFPSCGH